MKTPGEVIDLPESKPDDVSQLKFERVTLPVDRVLRDGTGRELDATIVGRSGRNLTVVRRLDKARLEVPINSLSAVDQAFAKSIPHVEEEPPYVKSRREEIVRLEERIRRLEGEVERSQNSILKNSHLSQIKKSKEEIAELKADIEFYEPTRRDE